MIHIATDRTKNPSSSSSSSSSSHSFPDKVMVRNYKTKEKCVVDEIRDAFPDLFWITDKKA